MKNHPNRWDMVPFTRGLGIEIGVKQPDVMFPHFQSCGPEGAVVRAPDLADLPFKDESLDFVVMRTENSIAAEDEARRVLKPDGNLVMLHATGGWVEKPPHGGLSIDLEEALPATTHPRACVVRYGGFGDQLQAANILPALKREGYHVTFMTTPKGKDITLHDPHIDEWFIQDTDQVPNDELSAYWAHMATRFDRFINLSESVEGTLLALPGRTNHAWPDAVRRKQLNHNYLEWTAELAGVPYTSESRFYASTDETAAARDYLMRWRQSEAGPMQRTPDHFTILWVLSGSSQHKFWPHMDASIASILRSCPEARIIFTGDGLCQMLEAGWEDEPRVLCESGKLSIRETLALAQVVDCVVGPETGVLNAVAFEDNAKVVMLSHSSHENLTKHWINTAVVLPVNTPCYPCHRMHYTREFCPEDIETGGAKCAVSIRPQAVTLPVLQFAAEKARLRDAIRPTLIETAR